MTPKLILYRFFSLQSKSSSSKESGDKKSVKSSPQKSTSLSKEALQAEKNRATLAVIKSMSSPAVKLAKIPRKPKPGEGAAEGVEASGGALTSEMLDKLTAAQQQRPKTVKTFNSKFRSTGLVEDLAQSMPKKPSQPVAPGSLPTTDKKLSPAIKRTGSADGGVPPLEKKMKAVDDTAISAAVAAVMKKTAAAEAAKPAVKLISARPRRKTNGQKFKFVNFLSFFKACRFVFVFLIIYPAINRQTFF